MHRLFLHAFPFVCSILLSRCSHAISITSTPNDRDYVDEESNKKVISLTIGISELTLVLKTAHTIRIFGCIYGRFYILLQKYKTKSGINKKKIKMTVSVLKVVLIVCLLKTIRSIPINPNTSDQDQGRLYFDAVTNWIMESEWLPIEVNVPDTISGMISGVQNAWTSTMGYFGISPPPRIKKTGKKLLRMAYLLTLL